MNSGRDPILKIKNLKVSRGSEFDLTIDRLEILECEVSALEQEMGTSVKGQKNVLG